MKYGFRKPSFNKSFKARTTGRLTRSYKRALNPYYGRKGMGYLHNPRKAIYNGIYHRTTVSPIPRSKTKAYRHAQYIKHKYGYIPNGTEENIHNEQYGNDKTLEDTDWVQRAMATDNDSDNILPKNKEYWTAKQTMENDKHEAEDNAAMAKVAKIRHERAKARYDKIIHIAKVGLGINKIQKLDKQRNKRAVADTTPTRAEKANNYREKKHDTLIMRIIEFINRIL